MERSAISEINSRSATVATQNSDGVHENVGSLEGAIFVASLKPHIGERWICDADQGGDLALRMISSARSAGSVKILEKAKMAAQIEHGIIDAAVPLAALPKPMRRQYQVARPKNTAPATLWH